MKYYMHKGIATHAIPSEAGDLRKYCKPENVIGKTYDKIQPGSYNDASHGSHKGDNIAKYSTDVCTAAWTSRGNVYGLPTVYEFQRKD